MGTNQSHDRHTTQDPKPEEKRVIKRSDIPAGKLTKPSQTREAETAATKDTAKAETRIFTLRNPGA